MSEKVLTAAEVAAMQERATFWQHSKTGPTAGTIIAKIPALAASHEALRALATELAEMIVELQNEMAHEGIGSHVPANRLLAKARAAGVLA